MARKGADEQADAGGVHGRLVGHGGVAGDVEDGAQVAVRVVEGEARAVLHVQRLERRPGDDLQQTALVQTDAGGLRRRTFLHMMLESHVSHMPTCSITCSAHSHHSHGAHVNVVSIMEPVSIRKYGWLRTKSARRRTRTAY